MCRWRYSMLFLHFHRCYSRACELLSKFKKGEPDVRTRDRLHPVADIVDATNPDLRPFRDAGARMVVVHGWSEEAIPASASIKWYEDVSAFMGGRDACRSLRACYCCPA